MISELYFKRAYKQSIFHIGIMTSYITCYQKEISGNGHLKSCASNMTYVDFFPIECRNSYFYIEKWAFKIMCEVCYRAKRDKKEAT